MENSWMMKVPIMHSSNDIQMANIFLCTCSNQDTIYYNFGNNESPIYTCSQCDNKYFLPAIDFHDDTNKVIYWKEFHWDSKVSMRKYGWKIELFYHAPVYKFSTGEVYTIYKKFFGIFIDFQGHKKYEMNDNHHILKKYTIFIDEYPSSLRY